MLLTEEEIINNKNRFIELVQSITRKGFKKEELLAKLESSDFYYAPASTIFHANCKGGLCYHSLNVYDQIMKLYNAEYVKEVSDEEGSITYESSHPYSEDSLKIVALFHDISKMNYYCIEMRNIKKPTGEWVKEPFFKVREPADRFIFGSHEENSHYMLSQFSPLSIEESCAILRHHGGIGQNQALADLNEQSNAFQKYPLVLLLHMADLAATYICEHE